MSAPFQTVLIANRGEIAVRIAKTARAMGIRTVAVYSDADAGAPHVRTCDVAVRIGPPPAQQSYLRIDAVIAAARDTGAQAIHPGYGFLSENARFASACADAGIRFVGPPPEAMRAMGDKIAAKKTAEAAGVPTVPGYLGDDQSRKTLAAHAKRIGVPLLIKASAGGGGKGMRVVRDLAEFDDALEGAQREALAAFGDGTVFLERYLAAPRHIEVQILADAHGACIHLGERECSVQRRHQKVLEETPSTVVSPALRAEMGAAAVRAAQAVGYVNAGTIEFMLDASGKYYFLEMNTRLQVEHPITEAVTGVDLVREQLYVAAGDRLRLAQGDIVSRGHAIEMRVYAEDAARGFLPSIGRITAFEAPTGPGLRVDTGVEAGSDVTIDYDPMLAKLIAYDRTRDACIERMAAALDDFIVGGVTTNIAFLRWLVGHDAFRRGETTTAFIDEHFRPEMLLAGVHDDVALLAAAAAAAGQPDDAASGSVWRRLGAWRHAAEPRTIVFAGHEATPVMVLLGADGRWSCTSGAEEAIVFFDGAGSTIAHAGATTRFAAWPSRGKISVAIGGFVRDFALLAPPSAQSSGHGHGTGSGAGVVEAPMSGKIVKTPVRAGDEVSARDVLVVMEAMKMEHTVLAPYDAVVRSVDVTPGDTVGAGDVLVALEAYA
ncbi:MAG TPA: acetyl-CoA carboxylase biotin carboxylase subunit [Candidatus Eremiobacteraceae bacterium]|nr:acetyl-CoA carboxylase biotin carboxylase subunit [Candidatus Eremiobacteraceae bacterium]